MSAKKVFPKVVYLYFDEYEAGEEPVLLACSSPEEIAVVGKRIPIGIYTLDRTASVAGLAKVIDGQEG